MAINRKFFFDQVRLTLFDGRLNPTQVVGLTAVLDKWERESPEADDRWLAYMLGTAHHETGRTMQPVRETFATTDAQAITRLNNAFNAGKLSFVKKPYWQLDGDGKSWLGRGLVQITHKDNYVRLGKLCKVDLTTDPTVAMQMEVALQIMFIGMREGAFSGKKLSQFFHGETENWSSARKIINGLERADLVASHAKKYYAAISHTL